MCNHFLQTCLSLCLLSGCLLSTFWTHDFLSLSRRLCWWSGKSWWITPELTLLGTLTSQRGGKRSSLFCPLLEQTAHNFFYSPIASPSRKLALATASPFSALMPETRWRMMHCRSWLVRNKLRSSMFLKLGPCQWFLTLLLWYALILAVRTHLVDGELLHPATKVVSQRLGDLELLKASQITRKQTQERWGRSKRMMVMDSRIVCNVRQKYNYDAKVFILISSSKNWALYENESWKVFSFHHRVFQTSLHSSTLRRSLRIWKWSCWFQNESANLIEKKQKKYITLDRWLTSEERSNGHGSCSWWIR